MITFRGREFFLRGPPGVGLYAVITPASRVRVLVSTSLYRLAPYIFTILLRISTSRKPTEHETRWESKCTAILFRSDNL